MRSILETRMTPFLLPSCENSLTLSQKAGSIRSTLKTR